MGNALNNVEAQVGTADTANFGDVGGSIKNLEGVYAYAQQQQEELTMVSTLGQLQQDAAKDKPQV